MEAHNTVEELAAAEALCLLSKKTPTKSPPKKKRVYAKCQGSASPSAVPSSPPPPSQHWHAVFPTKEGNTAETDLMQFDIDADDDEDNRYLSTQIIGTEQATLTIKPATISMCTVSSASKMKKSKKKMSMTGPLTIDLRTGIVYEGEGDKRRPSTKLGAKFVPRNPPGVLIHSYYEDGVPNFLSKVKTTTDLIGELLRRAHPRRSGAKKLRYHLAEKCDSTLAMLLCDAPPKGPHEVPKSCIVISPTIDDDNERLVIHCYDFQCQFSDIESDCRHPDTVDGNCMCSIEESESPLLYMDVVFFMLQKQTPVVAPKKMRLKKPEVNAASILDVVPGATHCWFISTDLADKVRDFTLRIEDGTVKLLVNRNRVLLDDLPSWGTKPKMDTAIPGPLIIDLSTGNVFKSQEDGTIIQLPRFAAKFIPASYVWCDADKEDPSFLHNVQSTSNLFKELINRAYPDRCETDRKCHLSQNCLSDRQVMLCADPPKCDNSLPDRAIFVELDTTSKFGWRLSLKCHDLHYPDAETDCRRNNPGSNDGTCMCVALKEAHRECCCPTMFMDVILLYFDKPLTQK